MQPFKTYSLLAVLVLAALVLSSCAPIVAGSTPTPTYPDHEIELVTMSSVGGGGDVVARQLAEAAKTFIKQPLVVVNKAGSAGKTWETYMAGKPKNAYTLGLTTASNVIYKYTEAATIDLTTDMIPVARLQVEPNFVVVPANSPYKTFKELSDAAKAGKVVFGGGPIGAIGYLFWVGFAGDMGFKLQYVAYGGGGEAVTSLLGGDTQAAFLQATESIDFLRAGKIRYLGIASARRYSDMPEFANVPTLQEQGYNFVFEHWRGVHALKGTPDANVNYLTAQIKLAMEQPGWKKWLADTAQIGSYMAPADFGKFVTEQDAVVKNLVTRANLLKVK